MRAKVLFLCTHNSARSQMAEGLLGRTGDASFEACSAGTVATRVRPEAIAVMGELGIDLSNHQSKTLDRFLNERLELVVTVCDHARDTCPTFPNAARSLHWSIPDPAAVEGSSERRLEAFRSARDELDRRIREEIVAPEAAARRSEHFRKLEAMYLAAPTNAHYRPELTVGDGTARVILEAREGFFHAGGAVHGAVYFKALDDACFFAANSLVEEFMVLTTQFNIHITRPISEGRLTAVGTVRHVAGRSHLVAGVLHDSQGRHLGRGEGTFLASRTRLTTKMGYRLP